MSEQEQLVRELTLTREGVLRALNRMDAEIILAKKEFSLCKEDDFYERQKKREVRARLDGLRKDRFYAANQLGRINRDLRAAKHVIHQANHLAEYQEKNKTRTELFVSCAKEMLPEETFQNIWKTVNERYPD